MNKEDFTIINGTGGKKHDKPIVWKSYGKGKPIRTLDPNTMKVVEAPNTISFGDFAFTATMSEEQLRNLQENQVLPYELMDEDVFEDFKEYITKRGK